MYVHTTSILYTVEHQQRPLEIGILFCVLSNIKVNMLCGYESFSVLKLKLN